MPERAKELKVKLERIHRQKKKEKNNNKKVKHIYFVFGM